MGIEDIGNNIRRQMKLKGLSIAKLASKIEIGTATLSNILNGKSEPKSSTLLKITNELGIKLEDALCDSSRLKSVRFRSDKTLSAREKAERDQTLVATARWLHDYRELEDMLDEHIKYRFIDFPVIDPVKMAAAIRNKLEINFLTPITDIASIMQSAGIKLRIYNFGFKKTFGLSVAAAENGPAIIVNSESGITIERQIFTVAHELGHLILHPDSYSINDRGENIDQEKEANLFAGNFLLPDEALKKEWEEASGLYFVDKILKIKKKFKISYLTVLVRLKQIYNELDYSTLIMKFNNEYKRLYNHDLKNHYEPEPLDEPVALCDPDSLSKSDLFEDRFEKLVRMAYDRELISISRAGEILNKSIMEMRNLVKSWKDICIAG